MADANHFDPFNVNQFPTAVGALAPGDLTLEITQQPSIDFEALATGGYGAGLYGQTPYGDGLELDGGLTASAVPAFVANDGGYEVTITAAGIPDGTYNVYLGDMAGAPAMYGGSGNGYDVPVRDGLFQVATPVIDIGGPHKVTLVPVGGGASLVTQFVITVVAHHFRTQTYSLRRRLPPHLDTGPRKILVEQFPQV